MCGIAGCVGKMPNPEQIGNTIDRLEHRGPDSRGVYQDAAACLIHTRLSIIDLTSAGNQPMKDDATGVVVILNGEIYNYKELRAGLAGVTFSSQSDTEVLLQIYLRSGMDCARMLRGMFAFAIWDPRIQTLHLCRDRMGIKPVYYHLDSDGLVFSSEIKGIISLGVPPVLNPGTTYEYLKYGRTAHTEETFFKGITSLEPATTLSFCQGQVREETYWSPPQETPEETESQDVEEELWEILKENMRAHLVSDVPVGISLSSGLDSRLIVSVLSELGCSDLHTFTWGYEEPEYDEIIRLEDQKFATPLTQHHLRTRPGEMLDNLERAISFYETPLGGLGTLAGYCMMQLPHDLGIKVLLSGEGADEIFGGYKYFYYSYFRDLFESGKTDLLQRELDAFALTNGEKLTIGSPEFQTQVLNETTSVRAPDGTSLGGREFIQDSFAELATGSTAGNHGSKTSTNDATGLDHLRRVMLRDLTQWKVPKLLWFQDRASMAWGVETRVPFLDHNLVEYAYRLPPNCIIRDGVSKYMLKRLLLRYGGVDHTKLVKHYVSAPQREWLKGPLFQQIIEYLDDGYVVQSGMVDYEAWKNAYFDYAQIPELGNSFFVWKMVNLEAMMGEFFSGKTSDESRSS